MFVLFLRRDEIVLLAISAAVLGITITPVIPISLELGVEVTYPVGEAMPTGLLMTAGQIGGIGMIFLMDWLIHQGKVREAGYGFLAFFGAAMVTTFFYFGELKRQMHEQQKTSSKNSPGFSVNL